MSNSAQLKFGFFDRSKGQESFLDYFKQCMNKTTNKAKTDAILPISEEALALSDEGDGLLCILHIKRNVPPWSAGLATRSVVGFIGAKVQLLFEIASIAVISLFAVAKLYLFCQTSKHFAKKEIFQQLF